MRSFALVSKIDRIFGIYQEMGWRGVLLRLWRQTKLVFGCDQEHLQWLREKSAVDTSFDTVHGTVTGGLQHLHGLKITGRNAKYGLSHIASDPDEFKNVIQRLGIDLREFTFLDFGSGKGRALILAASLPFRRIIGVEFAAELNQAAAENLSAIASGDLDRFELVWQDAAAYTAPVEPLIVYMYNPFGATVVRQVARNVLDSWFTAPRPLHVIYVNPLHLSAFTEVGWLLRERGAGFAILVPPASTLE